ncbi:dTDP-4-dehydrorhamnose reductase [Dokdonia sp.]|uniref:dTDP-4-dehydrorhamnose reductase n=1 Tax=Dokdonia sp. TaxID=2024995 RepID=UPI003263E640
MNSLKQYKKILITGADGQLGKAIQVESVLYPELDFIFATKDMLDISNPTSIHQAVQEYQPDFIINTAAYTAVDKAETDEDASYLLNEKAVHILATICKEHAIALIHISTDYVFDGVSKKAYTEETATNPKTIYGKSKLAGEKTIQAIDDLVYTIIRTSWLYSNYGHNFYKTMLRLGDTQKNIQVVNDQYGVPTLANDLAIAILEIIPKLTIRNSGIYHYSNEGSATWYAFAKAIFEYSKLDVQVSPVLSHAFPTVAIRPKNSILNSTKIVKTFGVSRPLWKDALQQII